ncbi:DMT family transporter [Lawsonibacter celer]|uniref:DMT family transporter n=1 Tax=Lawsonibacter celer TaxID=2986526 RepID=UPI001647674A|nr:multidrug resistance efflux transporter family protein [Lawsonibacter celer]
MLRGFQGEKTARAGGGAVLLGLLSSVFFSVTYVLNNLMADAGGSWLWSASLRFLIMFPILLLLVLLRGTLGRTLAAIRRAPGRWMVWSTVGFGLFYAPLTFASAYGPSWLVAGTFQFTIFAGALLTPLFWTVRDTPAGPLRQRGKVPVRLFPAFAVILAGVFLLQVDHFQKTDPLTVVLFAIPVLVSAFAYPLGNRKMMELCGGELGVIERVFGMDLCSLPFFLVLAAAAGATAGAPSLGQLLQSAVVALSSGIVATLVFFYATQLVRENPQQLALVESTQCGEVVFSLLGGILLLHNALPSPVAALGLVLIVAGMAANSLLSAKR